LVYCLEEYKETKGLTGKQVAELFIQKKAMEFIVKHFEVLHINGSRCIVKDIDDYIAKQA
jgi:hypothetical protein